MSSRARTHEHRSLRIAFVTPEPIPGGGVPGMAVTLARGLAALGHRVDCWTTAEARPDLAWADVEGLELHIVDGGFHWGRWYSQGPRAPLTASLAQIGSRARSTPTLVRRLLAVHRADPYDVVYRFSTLELLGFGRQLRHLPPMVVHPEVHAAGELRWVRAEAALDRRCHSRPHRMVVRGMLAVRSRQQRRDIRRVAGVLAPSHRFADLMAADYDVPRERFTVVPNPVDLEAFQPQPLGREAGAKVRLTYVGRAAVRKGIDQLVELSHRLDDLADEVELQIVASASLWSDYRPLLDEVNPRVATVLGPLRNRDVAARLAQTDVLVQPSKYEPFAITVAEALASGTPVIATDEVGASEGIDPTCLTVVPADDVDALEAAVRARVAEVRAGAAGPARTMARAEAERRFAPALVCQAVAAALVAVVDERPAVRV